MSRKSKKRVGAIISIEGRKIFFAGYGKCTTKVIPKDGAGKTSKIYREKKIKSIRVLLDNGKTIYGSECWLGQEEKVKNIINSLLSKNYQLIKLDVDKMRRIVNKTEKLEQKLEQKI